jgi:O-antigen ligase
LANITNAGINFVPLLLFFPRDSIIEVTASIAIFLWLLKKIFIQQQLKVEETPLNIPISLYFLLVLFSLINTKFFVTSLKGFGFKAMEHFLLFVVIIDTVKTRKDVMKITAFIFLSGLLMAADGLWQHFMHYDFLRGYPIWSSLNRITASFKFPNGFAGWLVTVVPFFMATAIFDTREKLLKFGSMLVTILLAACLILNFTKGALVALIPAVLFLVWRRGETAKKILLAILTVLLLGLVVIAASGHGGIISDYAARGWSFLHRLDLTKMCWRMFLDHPILGHGINTFMSIYETYASDVKFGGVSYAHNAYLQIAVETGALGFAAFLWLIAVLFVSSVKNIALKKEENVKTIQIAVLAGLIGYLSYTAVESTLYSLPLAILFYYFLGLAAALLKIE